VSEQVHNFSAWDNSAMDVTKEMKFGTKRQVGEDDSQTSNTCIAQRKHTIPHLTMKNNRNIIGCCNDANQGTPRTGK